MSNFLVCGGHISYVDIYGTMGGMVLFCIFRPSTETGYVLFLKLFVKGRTSAGPMAYQLAQIAHRYSLMLLLGSFGVTKLTQENFHRSYAAQAF